MKITLPLLPALLLLASGAALADDAHILQCRTLPDGPSRLACYDAIPIAGASAAASVSAAARPAALPAAAPLPAAAAPGAPGTAAPAASPEERFGLRPEVRKQVVAEPDSIRTTIAGRFDGWQPGMLIRLGNGQVWRVTDDTDAVLPVMQDPPVRVVRGLMGAFFLELDGVVNRARVARVK